MPVPDIRDTCVVFQAEPNDERAVRRGGPAIPDASSMSAMMPSSPSRTSAANPTVPETTAAPARLDHFRRHDHPFVPHCCRWHDQIDAIATNLPMLEKTDQVGQLERWQIGRWR